MNLYRFVHLTSYLTIGHGILYYVIKNFMTNETQYGIRPNEYQGLIQSVHIILSPILIFALGLLWKNHILKFFRKKSIKLYSGIILTTTLITISFSGYLIQIIYNIKGKEIATYIHLIFSALYIGSYLYHHFKKNFSR